MKHLSYIIFFVIGLIDLVVLIGYICINNDTHCTEIKNLNHRIAILDSTLLERDKEIGMLNQSVLQLYYQHEDDDSLMIIFNNQSK